MRMREGKNEGRWWERSAGHLAGRKETQTLGRLGKARYPLSSRSEGKRGRKHLQKLKEKDPHSESVWSASFGGFSGAGGSQAQEGASRRTQARSQGPCSDASPVERRSKLSRVIQSASPKGVFLEMSERKSISGTGNRFGERDEAQRMNGEGGHKETGCSKANPWLNVKLHSGYSQRRTKGKRMKEERRRKLVKNFCSEVMTVLTVSLEN